MEQPLLIFYSVIHHIQIYLQMYVECRLRQIQSLFVTTLISVLMFVTYATGALQFTIEIGYNHILGGSLSPYDDLNVMLIENFDSSATHTTADDDIHTQIVEEVRQEAGLVPRVAY